MSGRGEVSVVDRWVLLDAWWSRLHGGSQASMAKRLGVSRSAVSSWKAGETAPRLSPGELDRGLTESAPGVLEGLLLASGTPAGFDPDVWWSFVPGEWSGSWVWVRSASSEPVEVVVRWGVGRAEFRGSFEGRGVLLWTRLANPLNPIVVELSSPGWVDVGPAPDGGFTDPDGQQVDEFAGIEVEVLDSFVVRPVRDHFVLSDLASQAASVRKQQALSMSEVSAKVGIRLEVLENYLGGKLAAASGRQQVPATGVGGGVPVTGSAKRLRMARDMSIDDVAGRAGRLLGREVSHDTVGRFDRDVNYRSRVRHLAAAIDMALAASGRLGPFPITSGVREGQGSVRFPEFWRGPVWLAFDGPRTAEGSVRLRWGDFTTVVSLEGPTVVSMHAVMSKPLGVDADAGIVWRAGTGRHDAAVPVDTGWVPASPTAAARIGADGLARTARALGADASELFSALGARTLFRS